ncbi:hypothetical protein [Lentzea sp. NPDC003310]|uniref:hypothetical protein n=1 Tax=Lentzea sp. NPDC003310 TaxID=3154447 RepID=UPI0033AE1F6B
MTARRCVRHRADGRRCSAYAVVWDSVAVADPVACRAHLTSAEVQAVGLARSGAPLLPWRSRRLTPSSPTSHGLRKSLNKAAYLLAVETGRHPGVVNTEVNGVIGVERRVEADKEQLREGLRYVGERLRALGGSRLGSGGLGSGGRDAGGRSGFDGEPPF